MASNAHTKSEHQPRNGIVRKILNLLSVTMPASKAKRKKHAEYTQHAPVKAKAKSHSHSASHSKSHHAPDESPRSHAHATKVQAKPHAKHKTHSSHKKAPVKPDHSLQNPKDVIPETPQDPAHSPGHRRLHIEKDLH